LLGAIAGLLVVVVGTAADYAIRAHRSPPPIVLLAPVTRGAITGLIETVGTLAPVDVSVVSQPNAGRIVAVAVSAGDSVRSGQTLARIDSLALQAQLARAESRVVAAEAAAFEAELALARATAARAPDQSPPRPSEDREITDADAAGAVAEARVAKADSELSAREAEYRLAQRQLGERLVRAPISGIILSREVEPGQVVAPGAPLFRIGSDLGHLRVSADVAEAELAHVRSGQRASFTVPAFPGRTFEAQVVAVGALQGPVGAKRFPVTLAVDNASKSLSPGMTATVAIDTAADASVFRVPLAALDFAPGSVARTQDEPAVWLSERSGGPLTRTRVAVGVTDGRYAEVRSSALHEGFAVAVGYARLDKSAGQ
jgi:HlyD family secretion protein